MLYKKRKVLYHYLAILKKTSLPKALNFVRLFIGFHYSRILKKPVQFGRPVFMSIEPTTSCNLRCPQCPSGLREFSRPTGMLRNQLFEKIILETKKYLHSLTFYFQGEPYLNPDFLNMVQFAANNGIYTITSTNAHYLDDAMAAKTVQSGLDRLIISVDGITQDTYEKYRVGGKLDKVVEGTRAIVRQKKLLKSQSPQVVWQFVVFKHNQHQVAAVKKLGKELGVDTVTIKTAQVYDFEQGHSLIPDIDAYSRYTKKPDGTYRIKNRLLNQCWRMWQGCVITWDGKVVPCCFDKDATHKLGDLSTESFEQIWFSPAYNAFRGAVLKSRTSIDICTNCTEGTQVWA